VIYQIQIIGQAVRHLSPQLRQRHRAVAWQDIAGMRSKLVHDYFGVDVKIVWLTATSSVPALAAVVEEVLADSETG
jgi:uncharacterized protein with HEPN domain